MLRSFVCLSFSVVASILTMTPVFLPAVSPDAANLRNSSLPAPREPVYGQPKSLPVGTDCFAPPADMVSWWPAEGSAADIVGPNSGVLSNGVLIVPGAVGLAFSFDGVDDWVMVPSSPSLNMGAGQDFSLECWIKPEVAATSFGVQSIVDKRISPNFVTATGYSFHLEYGHLGCQIGAAGTGYITHNTTTPDLRDGLWHHVALTLVRNSTTGGKLYVDGKVVGVFDPTSQKGDLSTTAPLRIGDHADRSLNCHFKGLIDELSLYRRALSEAEILGIYAAGTAGKCPGQPPAIVKQPLDQVVAEGATANFTVQATGTAPLAYQWRHEGTDLPGQTTAELTVTNVQSANGGLYAVLVSNGAGSVLSSNALLTVTPAQTNCLTPPSGLISWWPAEGSAIDVAGQNHGQIVGNVGFAPGKVGRGFLFDGASLIQVPHHPSLEFSGQLTIQLWFLNLATNGAPYGLMANRGQEYQPINYGINAVQSGIGPYFNDPQVQGGEDPNPYETSRYLPLPSPLDWHHLAVTYRQADSTTVEMKTFVDGALAKARLCPGVLARAINSYPVTIGTSTLSGGEWFIGIIDEIAMFNRALTAEEVLAIYNADGLGLCRSPLPPTIVQQPGDQAVRAGGVATFNVSAGGDMPLSYQWSLNGDPVPGATLSQLVIQNAQPGHAGLYTVLVSNPFGTALSSNATLTVNQAPVAKCHEVAVPAGSNCLAMASIDNGSYDPDGDPITIEQLPPGPYFPGSNVVYLVVTDSHGNSNVCASVVTVLDTLPPTIVCPPNLVVTNAHAAWMSQVEFTVTASDNCSGLTVTADPPSGSWFPVGVTTVQCRAVDAAGNVATCGFAVTVITGNHAPTPVIDVAPLATFAGWTNLMVIAPDGTNAWVRFDGSKSYDMDDTNFLFFWFEGTNLLATTPVTTNTLALGSHEVVLWLDDTLPYGTNSASVTVEVITPSQAITILFSMLENSDLSARSRRPLEAALGAALAAFETGRFNPAANQLAAFQNKVRAQVAPFDTTLAGQLAAAAQSIIDALAWKMPPPQPRAVSAESPQ